MAPARIPIGKRFWGYVEKSENGCWLWRGGLKPNGYAMIAESGEGAPKWYAHRFSWTLHFGEIPEGLDICHHCDVRHCVRPDHLFAGTRSNNLMDCSRKGRLYSAFRDPAIRSLAIARALETRRRRSGTSRVLTSQQIAQIKDRLRAGRSQDFIAAKLGVSQGSISRVHLGALLRGYDCPVP